MDYYYVAFSERHNHRPIVILCSSDMCSIEEVEAAGLEAVEFQYGWTCYGGHVILANNDTEAIGRFVEKHWDGLRRPLD